jgi:hypothetical protein
VKKATILLVVALVLGGCRKDIQNEAAVKQGIMKYLASRQGLVAMDVSVTSMSFQADRCDATVHFQAKGNTSPGAGLDMKYQLIKKGGEWVVQGREGASAAHGQGMAPGGQMPAGHPTEPGAGGGELPPGHPSVPPGGAAGSPNGSMK